ncbi:MAG TPA: amidohydrolase family protein, partial [Vicinamibacterales bacterium]|nr:amidohydrolase family protein [Vicinamibacterales bacterium]
MRARLCVMTVVLLAASGVLRAQRALPAPDAIYVNAKVVTVDAKESIAQAFAVRGDRFVAVGTTAAMRARAGRATKIVDLHGRTVVPGLIDNHNHQYHVALLSYRGVDLKDVASLGDIEARLRRAVASAPAGATIFTTTGWSPDALPEKRGPTREELDALSSTHPIVVYLSRSRIQANT